MTANRLRGGILIFNVLICDVSLRSLAHILGNPVSQRAHLCRVLLLELTSLDRGHWPSDLLARLDGLAVLSTSLSEERVPAVWQINLALMNVERVFDSETQARLDS